MENPMFKKLIEKKKKEAPVNPMELKAKGSVLNDLMEELSGMGADKLKGLKKVTVAAPDQAGLKAGLDQAKSIVAKKGDPSMGDFSMDGADSDQSEEDPSEEAHESPEMEAHEQEDEKSKEEMEKEIADLRMQLARLGA